MNYKSIIKKQSFIITISVIVMAIILLGTSYALFIKKDNSSKQTVSSGTLQISYTGTAITTTGAVSGDLVSIEPISEPTGSNPDPYKIVITNTGTLSLKYNILIYTEGDNTLPHSYYSYKYKNNGSYTTKTPITSLSKVDSEETRLNFIKYKLTNEAFIINPGTTVTHEIYVWIDEDSADDDMDGKVANLKIEVEGEATNELAITYPTIVEKVQNIVSGESTSSTNVIDKGNRNTLAYDGTTDNNLRFVGADPSNYVQFNNELWRIIGVMNNIETEGGATQSLVKIRRAESLGNYSWDTSASEVNGGFGVNEWTQADLMQELNQDYLGTITVGTDGNWYSGQNNSKSTAKPSSTISSEAQDQIESVKWKLGSPNNNNGTYVSYDSEDLKAPYVYTHERGNNTGKICASGEYCNDTVTRQATWTGKVALMYPSDYLYATAGGNATNRAACLNTKQYNWNDTSVSDCKNNDWLYDSSNYQWTLSPFAYSRYARGVFSVINTGNVDGSDASNNRAGSAGGVCPVVFLKSNVKVTGGTGTQADPYILSL